MKIKENEKKKQVLGPCRKTQKFSNWRVRAIKMIIGALETVSKGLERGLKEVEIGGRAETIQTFSIIEIGQNSEKSLGYLRRLAVSQTLVKDQLTLV